MQTFRYDSDGLLVSTTLSDFASAAASALAGSDACHAPLIPMLESFFIPSVSESPY
jgi:hypothetical protein